MYCHGVKFGHTNHISLAVMKSETVPFEIPWTEALEQLWTCKQMLCMFALEWSYCKKYISKI